MGTIAHRRPRVTGERERTRSALTRAPLALLVAVVALPGLLGACNHQGLERSVDVDFLWVKTESGRPTDEGGLTRARVILAPNPSGDVRVGVLENAPGSIGEMWRAAVWLAAVMSAMETGQSLGGAKLTVEAEGFIDGPSAGSLMTAAMIAARSGDTVRGDVTMTGTVNPDGSIGPVGGLPQKVMAAIRQGKKRIGLPIGQGRSRDPVTGQIVNLVRLARSHGVEAIEIDDINAAYALLTGQRLNRPAALEIRDMELPPELRDNLRDRAKAWLQQAAAVAKSVEGLKVDAPDPAVAALWEKSSKRYEETVRFFDRGEFAAAYWHAADTAVQTEVAATMTRFASLARRQDVQGAFNTLHRLPGNVDQRFRALVARLRKRFPRTIGETLQDVHAIEAAIESAVHLAHAAGGYQAALVKARGVLTRPGPGDRVAASIAELLGPVGNVVLADADLRIAVDTLTFELPDRRGLEVTESQRDQLTDLFTRAAQANLHYFDTTFVDELAKSRGVSRDVALTTFAASDSAYFNARAHLKLAELDTFGEGSETQKLARLAGALSSFFGSASVIARYESFQVTQDSKGVPVSVGRERVFWRMLALAERKAREHAARAKRDIGYVPAPALVAYQIGRVYQGRPQLADKLEALEQFWRASMWSQLGSTLTND